MSIIIFMFIFTSMPKNIGLLFLILSEKHTKMYESTKTEFITLLDKALLAKRSSSQNCLIYLKYYLVGQGTAHQKKQQLKLLKLFEIYVLKTIACLPCTLYHKNQRNVRSYLSKIQLNCQFSQGPLQLESPLGESSIRS